MQTLFLVLLFVTAVFLILLVLVQRGKGGGLAGALGGMGGQSAFGTKAGDLFTKITVGVAGFWIIMCAFIAWYLSGSRDVISSKLGKGANQPGVTQPADTEKGESQGDSKAAPAGETAPKGEQKPASTEPAKSAPAPASTPAAPKTGGDAPKK